MHIWQAYAVRRSGMQIRETTNCNAFLDLNRVQADAALGDSPLWFGEWGLPTQFNATDDFLFMWADAQKLAYSQGAGWIVSLSFFMHPFVGLSPRGCVFRAHQTCC